MRLIVLIIFYLKKLYFNIFTLKIITLRSHAVTQTLLIAVLELGGSCLNALQGFKMLRFEMIFQYRKEKGHKGSSQTVKEAEDP